MRLPPPPKEGCFHRSAHRQPRWGTACARRCFPDAPAPATFSGCCRFSSLLAASRLTMSMSSRRGRVPTTSYDGWRRSRMRGAFASSKMNYFYGPTSNPPSFPTPRRRCVPGSHERLPRRKIWKKLTRQGGIPAERHPSGCSSPPPRMYHRGNSYPPSSSPAVAFPSSSSIPQAVSAGPKQRPERAVGPSSAFLSATNGFPPGRVYFFSQTLPPFDFPSNTKRCFLLCCVERRGAPSLSVSFASG